MDKIISLIISIIYLVIAYMFGGGEIVLKLFLFLLIPLGCIWFGDSLSSYTGNLGVHRITSESPGFLIKIAGWLLLLLPVLLFLIL